MNWSNAEFRELGRAYLASFDAAERERLRQRMTRVLADELPVIPLIWTPLTVAVSRRLTNVTIDPFEMRYLIDRVRIR
jgi:peptide/nickel transport system substrate-binding protein